MKCKWCDEEGFISAVGGLKVQHYPLCPKHYWEWIESEWHKTKKDYK